MKSAVRNYSRIFSALLITVSSALLVTANRVGADNAATTTAGAQMVEDPNAALWGYTPLNASVEAAQSLTWTNLGKVPHSATDNAGAWDTGVVAPGGVASVTFMTPGTYDYHCSLHPWMKGTLVVTAAAPIAPVSTDEPAPSDPEPLDD